MKHFLHAFTQTIVKHPLVNAIIVLLMMMNVVDNGEFYQDDFYGYGFVFKILDPGGGPFAASTLEKFLTPKVDIKISLVVYHQLRCCALDGVQLLENRGGVFFKCFAIRFEALQVLWIRGKHAKFVCIGVVGGIQNS